MWNFYRMAGVVGTLLLISAVSPVSAAEVAPLLETSFTKGASGWQAAGQAAVSDIHRRPDTGSLVIHSKQGDVTADAQWLSPPIKNPGGPVTISFWAADNYVRCGDTTYSACVDVVNLGDDAKESNVTDALIRIPWDEGRRTDMWGPLLPAGLVWKYYQEVYQPTGATFQIKFHWPKPLVVGDCYLSDVRVSRATAHEIDAAAKAKAGVSTESRPEQSILEISTPVDGNLFYRGAPLSFEILVYNRDGKPLPDLSKSKLFYDVTDFQKNFIASGETDFSGAKPVADPTFYKSRVGKVRKENLVKSISLADPAADEVGREFFVHVRLVTDGKEIASDTVTYGVVDPRPIAAVDYDKCHFNTDYFTAFNDLSSAAYKDTSIGRKLGVSWTHALDYYWVRVQPKVPGPMTFAKPLPAFPRMVWCPNIEQERTQNEWIKSEVPPEAIIADPLRPGHLTFKIDPYVDYIVAFIRHNRAGVAMVVPSGLERSIDARTIELQKKAYTAIKKEWPDLPVGMMLYGLSSNPSADVDLFLKEKLYDYCDFMDTHIYAPSVDWTEWERLQAAYKAMGRKPLPLISTEFSRVGGTAQVGRSRDMVAAHLDAFAHGMDQIYYYNQTNDAYPFAQPFLRENTDLGSDMLSGFLFMQRVNRPKVSPLIVPKNPRYRWGAGGGGAEFGGDSMMPLLQTLTYYNLVQNFECADYRGMLDIGDDVTGYVFERPGATIVALWLKTHGQSRTMRIDGGGTVTAQDLYGKRQTLQPETDAGLITVDNNPLVLTFEKHFAKPAGVPIKPVDGGLEPVNVARGTEGYATLRIPAVFASAAKVRVVAGVDSTWPRIEQQTVSVQPARETTIKLPMKIDLRRAAGTYEFTTKIYSGDRLIGWLHSPLHVGEVLQMQAQGVPMTRTQDPAIHVTVRSLRDTPSHGVIRHTDRYFATGDRPVTQEMPYTVPAHGSAEVLFPVPRELVNLTTAYDLTFELHDDQGVTLTKEEEIAFRATEHAPSQLKIDGDLSDWHRDKLTPVPFARTLTSWGKPWNGPSDCSGVLYTLWDKDYLYFAAVVQDDIRVQRFDTVDIWQDDNIMFGLYPWGWSMGQPMHGGYYREHLGLCGDGVARDFRIGNVANGPASSDGVKISVKYDNGVYTYEWAYPRASIAPMALEAGGRFRASVFPLDRDAAAGQLGGIQLGGFNENVDARPQKWREFILVK